MNQYIKCCVVGLFGAVSIIACGDVSRESLEVERISEEEAELEIWTRDGTPVRFQDDKLRLAEVDGPEPGCPRHQAPQQIELAEIYGGHDLTCGLDEGGFLYCWGTNDKFDYQSVPEDERFTEIVLGADFGCGLTVNQELKCFGEDNMISQHVPQGYFVQVETYTNDLHHAEFVTCALGVGGQIDCWGFRDSPARHFRPDGVYTALSDIMWIGAGKGMMFCGAKPYGGVDCWNMPGIDFDQDEKASNMREYPDQLFRDRSIYVEIHGSEKDICARTISGKVDCVFFGYRGYGANQPTVRYSPEGEFKALDASWIRPCGILEDGGLSCWRQSVKYNYVDGQRTVEGRDFDQKSMEGAFTKLRTTTHRNNFSLNVDGQILNTGVVDGEVIVKESVFDGDSGFVSMNGNQNANICGLKADSSFSCDGYYKDRYDNVALYECLR